MRIEIWFYDRQWILTNGHPDNSTMDGVLDIIECDASAIAEPDGWVADWINLQSSAVVCVRAAA